VKLRRFTVGLAFAAAAAAGCSGGSGDALTGTPAAVTLLDVQTQVFSPNCATGFCHIGAGAPHGLDLSSGAAAANLIDLPSEQLPQFLRVEPGNATDSYLFMKLQGDPRINGDQMPAENPPLSAGQLLLIESWIDQGAN